MGLKVFHEVTLLCHLSWRGIAETIFGKNKCLKVDYVVGKKIAAALSIEERGNLSVVLIGFDRLDNGAIVAKGRIDIRFVVSFYMAEGVQKLYVSKV